LPAIERLADALNRHHVKWVLVGGMAVMFHGATYLTSDCDLAYEKSLENLERLSAALHDLGARPVRASDDGDFDLDLSILLAPFMHLKTEAGPVDLISRLPNIESCAELYARSLAIEVDGVEIRIAALEDLIRLNTGTNRERDQLHLAMLKAIQKERNL
jgi:predicted nucleotidyltransferase